MSDILDNNAEASTSTASAPVMFKKRNKAGGSSSRTRSIATPEASATNSRDGSVLPEENDLPDNQDDDDRDGTPSNLADLIALRKLRQSTKKQGIDLEKLNAGNAKAKKKKRKQPEEEAQQAYGLSKAGSRQVNDADSDDDNEGDSITRKIMKTDNFTHQTGILDVDKHMMAYIERELKKRRGQESGELDTEKELQSLDPRDELYKVAEKYRTAKKHVEEGDVTTSSAMLTAIPEIDLGIDNRLKNIEATEMAKRRLMEKREKNGPGAGDDYHDSTYAGSRFFRHARGNQTDFDALRAAKIEAGIEDDDENNEEYEKEMATWFKKEGGGKPKPGTSGYKGNEVATDDMVAERFKRKGLLNTRGRR